MVLGGWGIKGIPVVRGVVVPALQHSGSRVSTSAASCAVRMYFNTHTARDQMAPVVHTLSFLKYSSGMGCCSTMGCRSVSAVFTWGSACP